MEQSLSGTPRVEKRSLPLDECSHYFEALVFQGAQTLPGYAERLCRVSNWGRPVRLRIEMHRDRHCEGSLMKSIKTINWTYSMPQRSMIVLPSVI